MQDDLSVFQPAAEYVPLLDEIYARLQREVAPVPGAFVEHNKFSVTVHFRRVAEQVTNSHDLTSGVCFKSLGREAEQVKYEVWVQLYTFKMSPQRTCWQGRSFRSACTFQRKPEQVFGPHTPDPEVLVF